MTMVTGLCVNSRREAPEAPLWWALAAAGGVLLVDLIALELFPPAPVIVTMIAEVAPPWAGVRMGAFFDAVIAFYVGACLLTFQRGNARAVVLVAALAASFVAASWQKYAVLGSGLYFGDIFQIMDLARAVSLQAAVAVALLLGVIAAALVVNARRPPATAIALYLPALALAALLAGKILGFPGLLTVPDPMEKSRFQKFQLVGHSLAFVLDTINYIDQRDVLNDIAKAVPIPGIPDLTTATVPPLQRRNVHVIVVESLMDPLRLSGYRFSEDPFTETLRRARADAGLSLGPVFGAGTAEVEFEVLCGLPVPLFRGRVLFHVLHREAIDCLPRKLAAQGWNVLTTVPVKGGFFEAEEAYRKMGVKRSIFAPDLDMADRDGEWLSNQSLFEQVYRSVEGLHAAGRPYLNYVVTTSGHFPFDLNEARRPRTIRVSPPNDALERYTNLVRYGLSALETYLAKIRALDPDALVVIVGDHAPSIGMDFASYRAGGLVPRDSAHPAEVVALYEMPLVILDRFQPVATGRVAHYMIPSMVLDLLSSGEMCRGNPCGGGASVLRPFVDFTVVAERDGRGSVVCWPGTSDPTPQCRDALAQSLDYKRRVFALTRK